MPSGFTIGDVIRKARIARHWNQERLGAEAGRFQIRGNEVGIDKSTVSKVENDPYSSELGTVWRLLAALDLRFSHVEEQVGVPFAEAHKEKAHHSPAGREATRDQKRGT